jgi:hypothetical protein
MHRFPSCLPLLLLVLPAGAQRSQQGSDQPEAVARSLVAPIDGPDDFGDFETLVVFDGIVPGNPIEDQLAHLGVAFALSNGISPRVQLDEAPRQFEPRGRAALNNEVSGKGAGTGLELGAGDSQPALRIQFARPISRCGFEFRSCQPSGLNLIVSCASAGRELGQHFFEVAARYSYVGVECALPFDELSIRLTNPEQGAFNLDNLRFEVDTHDSDGDGWPDFADYCPKIFNPDQSDMDGDGRGDACDRHPLDPLNDVDDDGLPAEADNCPEAFNPDQEDHDHDGIGDACDPVPVGGDTDRDGIADALDNCPGDFNPEQADCDGDGIGDLCDPSLIAPASVDVQLSPGESITVTKSVCLPPAPPMVDVVIAFDVTGSMGGEIVRLKKNIGQFVRDVRSVLPFSDIRFGLVSHRDYRGTFGACGYRDTYGRFEDLPFIVNAPIGTPDPLLLAAIGALEAEGGHDQPESYARVLWEIGQPDSGIGFRPGAARFLVLVGDNAPHDCNVTQFLEDCGVPFSTGPDLGRDGGPFSADDLDFQVDSLPALLRTKTKLLTVFSGTGGICAWEQWSRMTGGRAVHARADGTLPPGTNLAAALINLIRYEQIDEVRFRSLNSCGLELSFEPPFIDGPIDVTRGARITFQETIRVPDELPSGVHEIDCSVRILADGNLIGVQTIHVDIGCQLRVLDFESEDDLSLRLENGQAISTPPEFGRLVAVSGTGPNLGPTIFDSTPGGPNDPSPNHDLLIGTGNILVLQDSSRPAQGVPGYFDVPVDDPDGGDVVFDFMAPADPRSLLLADINPPPNEGASVTLVDERGLTRVYLIDPGWTGPYGDAGPYRLDLTTLLPQPGNGTPRWARARQDKGFEQTRVVRIVVHFTGSGALDELAFCQ